MLLTYFIAIFAFASANTVVPIVSTRGFLEDQINNTLNKVAADLAKKDPYIIPELTQTIDNGTIRLNFTAKDMQVHGISKFVAKELKVTMFPPTIAIVIAFENLTVSIGEYDLSMKASFVPLYGHGNLTLTSQNIVLNCSAAASFSPLGIKDLNLGFNLDTVDLHVTGLLNNEGFSQIISSAISEVLPGYVQKYGVVIGKLISKPVEDLINDLIPIKLTRVKMI
ncbi:hypothetical protein PPYR_09182 [Photinus pyralis]|uniref:Lipid-binding serum glycoprotein N-terminal domain-containing protein n=1 Tax=Photinus pyralis TaxID=7054 RepID=A0A5N4ALI7_PHOPY|nr:uncharacterized protein LOC116172711 [Photinus pyralis]KAB0798189.1 hypothetical protein PPYR_09182 [Photinus pyralis]